MGSIPITRFGDGSIAGPTPVANAGHVPGRMHRGRFKQMETEGIRAEPARWLPWLSR